MYVCLLHFFSSRRNKHENIILANCMKKQEIECTNRLIAKNKSAMIRFSSGGGRSRLLYLSKKITEK